MVRDGSGARPRAGAADVKVRADLEDGRRRTRAVRVHLHQVALRVDVGGGPDHRGNLARQHGEVVVRIGEAADVGHGGLSVHGDEPHLARRVVLVGRHHPHVRALVIHASAGTLNRALRVPDHLAVGVDDDGVVAVGDAAAGDDEALGLGSRIGDRPRNGGRVRQETRRRQPVVRALAHGAAGVRGFDVEGVIARLLQSEQQRSVVRFRQVDRSGSTLVEHAGARAVQGVDDLGARQVRQGGRPFDDPDGGHLHADGVGEDGERAARPVAAPPAAVAAARQGRRQHGHAEPSQYESSYAHRAGATILRRPPG